MPDERSELVPWGLCLHNDSPSLAGRVDPSRLRLLHPKVSLEDCRRLHIPSVSQVWLGVCVAGTGAGAGAGAPLPSPPVSRAAGFLASITAGLSLAPYLRAFCVCPRVIDEVGCC